MLASMQPLSKQPLVQEMLKSIYEHPRILEPCLCLRECLAVLAFALCVLDKRPNKQATEAHQSFCGILKDLDAKIVHQLAEQHVGKRNLP